MKTLYLECGMGAAGDMLMAALLELLPEKQSFIEKMNALGLPGVRVSAEESVKCGVTGTHMKVLVNGEEEESFDDHGHEHHHDHEHEHEHHHDHDHDHEHHHDHDHDHENHHDHDHEHGHDHEHHHHHHHASLKDIEGIMNGLDIPQKVREDAKAVYSLIARAEGQVHGKAMDEIHFHEVGTLDAVADVVGVCLLMHMIGAEKITASPIHVGSGYVRCMHGVLPVPAPATALILNGVPTYGGRVEGELCTPTGAALVKHFAQSFGDRPLMTVNAIGYGMGKKDFERANCLRAFLGESAEEKGGIVKLECNLDDMTGEEMGFAMERLLEAGAMDVYTLACGMKKNRPGMLLTLLCKAEEADDFARLMLTYTTTRGVRRLDVKRYTLDRQVDTLSFGDESVRVKRSSGMGVHREKLEYDDLARLAKAQGKTIDEIRRAVEKQLEC